MRGTLDEIKFRVWLSQTAHDSERADELSRLAWQRVLTVCALGFIVGAASAAANIWWPQ